MIDTKEFQANRARFSWEELRKYDGRWVAFSGDGRRIVASHEDLLQLDALIRAAGEDPENVALERVVFDDDCYLGLESH